MEDWEQSIERFVAEAREVLSEQGFPTEWAELEKTPRDVPNEFVGSAISIVAAYEYLNIEIDRGRTKKALSRLFSLLSAYEDMGLLTVRADVYGPYTDEVVAKANARGPLNTDDYIKDLKTGIASRLGVNKSLLAPRGSKETKETLMAAIDKVCANTRLGIGDARNDVGEKYNLSGRQVGTITKFYNPRKKV